MRREEHALAGAALGLNTNPAGAPASIQNFRSYDRFSLPAAVAVTRSRGGLDAPN
jgi:hypothetical protein